MNEFIAVARRTNGTRFGDMTEADRARTRPETADAVYLDWNASAPLDPCVAEVMVSTLSRVGNASSPHAFGQRQAAMVREARERIAGLVGSRPSGVVFTASATEANNLALCGAAREADEERTRILISAVEHASVLHTAKWLGERDIVQVELIPVTDAGFVDTDALREMIDSDVLLVSVMAANGETGVLNPIAEVAELARSHGSVFHCDASQFVGHLPLDAEDVGIDLVSISAHKIGGPMGVGALVGTRHALARLQPVIHGGGHERGLRSGSLNVPGIVGFAVAAGLAIDGRAHESKRLAGLRDRLAAEVASALPGVTQIGDIQRRLPNTACIRFRDADAEAVTVNLEPVAVSTGSACAAGSIEPSHVLLAMGMSRSAAFECVRFSLGRSTTDTDIEFAAMRAVHAVRHVRRMNERVV